MYKIILIFLSVLIIGLSACNSPAVVSNHSETENPPVGNIEASELLSVQNSDDEWEAYRSILLGDFTLIDDDDYRSEMAYLYNFDTQDGINEWKYIVMDFNKDSRDELFIRFSPAINESAFFRYADGKVVCVYLDVVEGSDYTQPLKDGKMLHTYDYWIAPSKILYEFDSDFNQVNKNEYISLTVDDYNSFKESYSNISLEHFPSVTQEGVYYFQETNGKQITLSEEEWKQAQDAINEQLIPDSEFKKCAELVDSGGNIQPPPASVSADIPAPDNEPISTITGEQWELAYRDFMVNDMNIVYVSYDDSWLRYPPSEVRLIELNFNDPPELAVVHNSGGAMGAVSYFYYYDGFGVKNVMDSDGTPAGSTTDVNVYLDTENSRLFFYYTMWGFVGNDKGQYGYLNEVVNKDMTPFFNNLIRVSSNWQADNYSEKAYNANTENEDAVLSNEDLIIAQEFSNNAWNQITGKEYIEKRNQLIIPGKEYADYMEQVQSVALSQFNEVMGSEERKVIPTNEEMDSLFSLWEKARKK